MASLEIQRALPQGLQEKCGVFGLISTGTEVAMDIGNGLTSIQHRGQEAAGIMTSDGSKIEHRRRPGLVSQVFQSESDYKKLHGHLGIGHTLYRTSRTRPNSKAHLQPISGDSEIIGLAHNGNLPDTTLLENFVDEKNIPNPGFNDSELMHAGIEYYIKKGASLEEAVVEASPLFTGAWSLVMMDKEKLVAARDPKGIRPLSIGKYRNGFAVSSETIAFKPLNATHIRDVFPGEMVVFDGNSIHSIELAKGEQKLDMFEMVYFARPDSYLLGQNIELVRQRMGARLAQEVREKNPNINIDLVVGVPKSGLSAARGFAQEFGVPNGEGGIVQNGYLGRVFITPEHEEDASFRKSSRAQNVRMKLSAIREILEGKNIMLTDDSIVRGTTYGTVVEMVREAGAREVHVGVSSAEAVYPDFYGIDTPDQSELFAVIHRTNEERRQAIGADSLTHLSIDGMVEATNCPKEAFSLPTFNGEYPIDIGKRKEKIDWRF